ncbi:uncharacterized protein SPSK_09952 [Sporothrix schenckii 1099-18]|uniref:Uncharacterized protein n=1 Tax=Sporothrix schenckii 1099-18 TaxID=1397361 RepID=A0A0F2MAW3_SPOSC|nr:uncharacterized protein SPSK_09952 [Sporothrix schenckii 1099-18]KJR85940.1 hypothetical protein SPSK_09952 [Sporothrix schenckii 1099-18]
MAKYIENWEGLRWLFVDSLVKRGCCVSKELLIDGEMELSLWVQPAFLTTGWLIVDLFEARRQALGRDQGQGLQALEPRHNKVSLETRPNQASCPGRGQQF